MMVCKTKHLLSYSKAKQNEVDTLLRLLREVSEDSCIQKTTPTTTGMEYDIMFQRITDEGWLVEGNSTRLMANNEYFRKLIHHSEKVDDKGRKVIEITEPVDGRSYKNLVKHIQGEPITFSHHDTAISSLWLSNTCLCVTLAEKAVTYMLKNLDNTNVLRIFQGIYPFCNPGLLEVTNDFTPSAPNEDHPEPYVSMFAPGIESTIAPLKDECIKRICAEGTNLMRGEDFEDLDRSVLKTILSLRDLRVPSESRLLSCLVNWAHSECMRIKTSSSTPNVRQVLGDLLYKVRFLIMSQLEFQDGSAAHGLLSEEERDFILRCLGGNEPLHAPHSLIPHLHTMKLPRCHSNKKDKKKTIGKKVLTAIGYGVCALADVVVG